MVTAAMRDGFAKAAAPGPALPRARQNEPAAKRKLLFKNPKGCHSQGPAKAVPVSSPLRPVYSVRATPIMATMLVTGGEKSSHGSISVGPISARNSGEPCEAGRQTC